MGQPQIWSLASWSAVLSRLCGVTSPLNSRAPSCGHPCPRGEGYSGYPETAIPSALGREKLQLQVSPGRDQAESRSWVPPRVSFLWETQCRPLPRRRSTGKLMRPVPARRLLSQAPSKTLDLILYMTFCNLFLKGSPPNLISFRPHKTRKATPANAP